MAATKPENINTLRILLSLDKEAAKDLANLSPLTLEKITESYIENARRSNIKMVDEHINTMLPVVGSNILVNKDGEWVKCKRESFINSSTALVEFVLPTGSKFSLPRTNIKWKAP